MAKSSTPKEETDQNLGQAGEYHLPIEPKPGLSAGSGLHARRLMILLSLALSLAAALLVWWLGTTL